LRTSGFMDDVILAHSGPRRLWRHVDTVASVRRRAQGNAPGASYWLHRVLKLIHSATPDTTKLSCVCRFGGVNWIPEDSRLSPTETLKSDHVQSNCPVDTVIPDTTQTGPSCCVWCGGVSWALGGL